MRVLGQHADLKQTSNQHARIRHVSVQFDAGEQAPPAYPARSVPRRTAAAHCWTDKYARLQTDKPEEAR
jgi:hypothetical protein